MIYKWAAGSRFKLKAQEVGDTLENLRKAHGGLNTKLVVDAARSPESSLHTAFEWDDSRAAEFHRQSQARNLIASVIVVKDDAGQPTPPVRAFVVVNRGKEDAYTHITVAMTDPTTRQAVLDNALRELAAFQKKYAALSELAGVFAEIESAAKGAA